MLLRQRDSYKMTEVIGERVCRHVLKVTGQVFVGNFMGELAVLGYMRCVCVRVLWGQRLSGVIESCLQGAAPRTYLPSWDSKP